MDSSGQEEARRDELEALAAIYADDWAVEDARRGSYSLTLAADATTTTNDRRRSLKMLFRLPKGYPGDSRPLVELSAPWMDREEKACLVDTIEELCAANPGVAILYMIAEAGQQTIAAIREREEKERENQIHENQPEIELIEEKQDQSVEDDDKRYQLQMQQQQQQQQITISHGDPLVDRRSTFQAHLAAVRSPEEAAAVLAQLKSNRKVASATHNIWAYRIVSDASEQQQTAMSDCDDDGETHAGSRLLHLLTIVDARNVMVVVSRWYGGVQLGPDRFKHINNVARQLLLAQNYISAK